MSTHTPGPWYVELAEDGRDAHEVAIWSDSPQMLIARRSYPIGYPNSENEAKQHQANAALIAKAPIAPKLAEALRALVAAVNSLAVISAATHNARDKAQAALAEWDNAK